MKRDYGKMTSIYLYIGQYQFLKEVIFNAFKWMDDDTKSMACEIVHEINSAMEELEEKVNAKKEDGKSEDVDGEESGNQ